MKILIILIGLITFSACSVFQSSDKSEQNDTTSESTDEVYVFDEVTEDEVESDKIKDLNKKLDAIKENSSEEVDVFDETVTNSKQQDAVGSAKHYLQLGAFSTLKRAEVFVRENDSMINFTLSIMYNPQTSLYNVRSNPYDTKAEVEVIKNDFWKKNLFKDAFIVSE